MRSLIIGLGFVLGSAGFFMAYAAIHHVHEKIKEAGRVEAEISELEQKISRWKELHSQPAVPLGAAYASVINDMNILARAHRVAYTMSLQGAGDGDVEKNARPSIWEGLREIHFQVVFSGLVRRGTLLSLLDALASFEEDSPVLLRELDHEKDTLAFDLAVIAP